MRRDGFTNGATYEEIIEMSIKSKNTQYDILVSDIKYDPKKMSMLREFYAEHNNGKELSEKLLKSLGFVNEEGYLLNGAVLFLDDYKEKKPRFNVLYFQDIIILLFPSAQGCRNCRISRGQQLHIFEETST